MLPESPPAVADHHVHLANILPTDWSRQGPARPASGPFADAKALVSGNERISCHVAKVRVAGSNPVVRSNSDTVVRSTVVRSKKVRLRRGPRGDLLDRWFESCSSDWSPGIAYRNLTAPPTRPVG